MSRKTETDAVTPLPPEAFSAVLAYAQTAQDAVNIVTAHPHESLRHNTHELLYRSDLRASDLGSFHCDNLSIWTLQQARSLPAQIKIIFDYARNIGDSFSFIEKIIVETVEKTDCVSEFNAICFSALSEPSLIIRLLNHMIETTREIKKKEKHNFYRPLYLNILIPTLFSVALQSKISILSSEIMAWTMTQSDYRFHELMQDIQPCLPYMSADNLMSLLGQLVCRFVRDGTSRNNVATYKHAVPVIVCLLNHLSPDSITKTFSNVIEADFENDSPASLLQALIRKKITGIENKPVFAHVISSFTTSVTSVFRQYMMHACNREIMGNTPFRDLCLTWLNQDMEPYDLFFAFLLESCASRNSRFQGDAFKILT